MERIGMLYVEGRLRSRIGRRTRVQGGKGANGASSVWGVILWGQELKLKVLFWEDASYVSFH